ncbi:TonB-dependent receptor [Ulvibacter litoralis]|uniref:Outer membrane cobalamin receptor protein n=1 Tax=Ulvibacter litoralis TaxID=227084 RepID=A0A1G7EZR8_9FLAO|nr:TonB-dependent receptor [Ulvibacter litoralis]GHC53285.1 TonB-dependent receptor [Ulvibacter litoralis]SDE69161.1 Outer membrane cobalamin receptor protein [Ulvibacter litoralis]
MKQYTQISLVFIFILFASFSGVSQNTISGTVTQPNGTPIVGANVYLEGTYDGVSTNEAGQFSFETQEEGIQTLFISYVSYEPFLLAASVTQMKDLKITLREDVNSLDTVVISAGSFEASDNSKVSVLKPLDVVTTASALGDFVGALQTLPGTTTVAEDGRLFVRGGSAEETQIFIDGIRVFTPYTPTTNNVPTRGRYSPFLFDGITFSTGGYSAEYGQALSSVLLLNTIDEPDQEKTDISLMTVGAGIGNTQKWTTSSLSVNASYINLEPYTALLPDRNEWQKPFEAISGETVFRQKFEEGLLKVYAAFDTTNFQLDVEDINVPEGINFALKNNNFYTNVSYRERLGSNWKLFAGGSYTFSKNKTTIESAAINTTENSAHLKLKFRKKFNNRFKLSVGSEQFSSKIDEDFNDPNFSKTYGYSSSISSLFSEADIIFSKKFALKLGVRGEYSEAFNEFTVSPRASVAYKTGRNSQLSLAYGDFYQQASSEVLKFTTAVESQKTQHFIANYQYAANHRIFRAELYRKQYSNLITYPSSTPEFDSNYGNDGDGYAQGIDLFWRDDESIKNVDYWVSYSLLDTQRKYQNYPTEATPSFANTHNLSVVAKYWINDWKSQVGFSYQFGSGRSYTDVNKPGFLQDKLKDYHSISLNWAYLLSQQKILYFSVNNPFGFKNVNGYQYADTPNTNGVFNRRTLLPAADQFFFVGFFWTISDDKSDNQLDNL